jgi:carbon-monoxide dehydrogenase medium subunit
MIPANFDYEAPRTLDKALALLQGKQEAKVLAGGHSLLPAMKLRLAQPPLLVDIGRIAALNYIREAGDKIAIGATTTHAQIAESGLLRDKSPLLAETAGHIGDVQVRNRGTIGGSIAHADPAADYPAALLALDAEIVAVSISRRGAKKMRTIPATQFFTGLFSTALQPDELITEIRVPATTGAGVSYQKFHHPASGFAVIGVAAVVRMNAGKIESAAIGITGVADHAYRDRGIESALAGQPPSIMSNVAAHAADVPDALGDHFASAEYRRHLASVYVKRAIEAAIASLAPARRKKNGL